MQGVSTRSVAELVKAMGMTGISKSQVSRLCAEIDDKIKAFLDRPLEGDWPYVWLDATYVKARRDGRTVSVAVIVAVGVNSDGRREVLGIGVSVRQARSVRRARPAYFYSSPPLEIFSEGSTNPCHSDQMLKALRRAATRWLSAPRRGQYGQ